MNTGKVGKI